jgi:hypothetical protein
MNERIGKDEYILLPKRDRSTKTMMNDLSRGFSHYKEGTGIKKDISLSNLRKTYLTWHHQVLGDDTVNWLDESRQKHRSLPAEL